MPAFPWDDDPHYLARLATCATELRHTFGSALAVRDIEALLSGYVLSPEETADSLLLTTGASTAEVEDQIAIHATVHASDYVDVVQLLRQTFNILEDCGERPTRAAEASRHAWIAVLPRYLRPDGWRDDAGYPNTFTVELIVCDDDAELRPTFHARWIDAGGLFFRQVTEEG